MSCEGHAIQDEIQHGAIIRAVSIKAVPKPTPRLRSFTCNHCGDCCRQILVHLSGDTWVTEGTFGLALWPHEVRLFPPDHIQPFWRSGPQVLQWQMATEPCPHWTGQACAIYSRRPLACRAYPVQDQFVCYIANTACPVVKARPEGSVSFMREVAVADQIARLQRDMYGGHVDLEYFDLGTGRWRRP